MFQFNFSIFFVYSWSGRDGKSFSGKFRVTIRVNVSLSSVNQLSSAPFTKINKSFENHLTFHVQVKFGRKKIIIIILSS
jgi:hypothetical protein